MTVKITDKEYKIPAITFRVIAHMEDLGYSLFSMISKRNVMFNTLALACISLVMDLDKDDAVDEMERHIDKGGDIVTLAEALLTALEKSDYFTKAFAQNEDVEKKAKATKTTAATKN